jgi:hypothetical protein
MMPESNPLVQSQIKHDDMVVPLAKSEDTYEDYFNELSKLQENDVIVRSNCKFCTHPARAEAELRFEKSGHFANVQHFFDEWNKTHPDAPAMNMVNIRTHIHNHYLQQQKSLWLREYSEKIRSVMNMKINDDRRLDMLRHQFEIKLFEIAADPTLDVLKAADAMVKIGKTIADITVVLGKLRGDIQPVQLLRQTFESAWEQIIIRETDVDIQRALLQSLSDFQSRLEGVPLIETEET